MTVVWQVKRLLAFCGARRMFTAFTVACNTALTRGSVIRPTFLPLTSYGYILMLFSSLRQISLSLFRLNYAFLISYTRTADPTHTIILIDQNNNIM